MKKVLFLLLLTYAGISVYGSGLKSDEEYFKLGNKYFDKEDYKTAIAYFDSTIMVNPEHTEAYAFRGVCKFELKQYRAAIDDFDLALILEKGYAEVYFFRGVCYSQLGEDKKACDDWTNAYNLGLKKAMDFILKNCGDILKENKTKKK